MTKQNIVVAPLATITLSDGAVHYLNRGAIVPKETSKEQLKHLLSVGVVESVEVLEVVETTEGTKDAASTGAGDVIIPEGDPTVDWEAKPLRAYAEREQIDIPSSARSKADIFAAIQDARASN